MRIAFFVLAHVKNTMAHEKAGRRQFLQSVGGAVFVGSPFQVSDIVAEDRPISEGWHQSGYISANTGYAASNTGPTGDIRQAWIFEDVGPQGITTDVVVVGATVYVGGDSGFYALATEDATKRWTFGDRTNTSFGSPSVANNTVFVASDPNGETGTLYALSAQDRTEQWTYELNNGETQPRVDAGTVYISGSNNVYAISATDGSKEWESPSPSGSFLRSSLAVADDTVYIGDSVDTGLHAFSADTGSEKWYHETNNAVGNAPSVANGTVYIVDDGGILHAVSTTEGTEQWRFDTVGSGSSSASVAEQTLFVIGKDLYALDSSNGEVRWQYKIRAGDVQPAIAGNLVYVLDSRGIIHGLNRSDGNERWSYEVTGATYSTPAIADGNIYLGTTNGVTALTEAGILAGRPRIDADSVPDIDLDASPRVVPEEAENVLPAAVGGLGIGGAGLWWLARRGNDTKQETPDNDEPFGGVIGMEANAVTDDEFEEWLAEEFDEGDATEPDESTEQATDGSAQVLPVLFGYLSPSRVKEWWLTRQGENTDIDDVEETETTNSPETTASEGLPDPTSEFTLNSKERETAQSEVLYSPDKIPTVPSVEVEYDKLTNREPIGEGGNADVMKATLPTADGDIALAIKEPRMHGTLHTDDIERLLKEAEIWSKLDSNDHIVGIVEYGSNPLPWIAMEYMDGGHLGERNGEMDIQQALWTSIAITNGLHHAHRRGVAHLDLKPENILFRTVQDAWDVPKIADWGLSKHLLEHPGSVEGMSPHYAAPEQFDDEYGATDDITDIYQLGAVCYNLVTGEPPFSGEPAEAMYNVLHTQPTSPSELADVPEGLDQVLLTALAKEKSNRYDSVVLFRNDLRELLNRYQ